MKKHGFTLAEVLVTLGIIGVVAALTTPALIQNVGNAKIGPKLQKAKATFETAAEMMLTENNANTITSVETIPFKIGRELAKYMKTTSKAAGTFKYYEYASATTEAKTLSNMVFTNINIAMLSLDDGTIMYIVPLTSGASKLAKEAVNTGSYADIPNNQMIGYLYVDVNGEEKPNRIAKDLFTFVLYNDGTLRPYGAKAAVRGTTSSKPIWSNDNNCNDTSVKIPETCTGSIFENGMKIIYE